MRKHIEPQKVKIENRLVNPFFTFRNLVKKCIEPQKVKIENSLVSLFFA